MAYETILYEKRGPVGLLTLNRPQRLNALSRQLMAEATQVIDELEKDDSMRVLVITGARREDGRPCFSAGADMRERAEDSGAGPAPRRRMVELARDLMKHGGSGGMQSLWLRIEAMSKMTIAAIDGICTAGGMEVALACDIRVVSETAQVVDLHIKNTGAIGNTVSSRLARTVGRAWAKELMMTGEALNGQQAVAIGFANHVYPPEKLVDGAVALATKIAAARPEAVEIAKASIDAAIDLDPDQALRYTSMMRAAIFDPEWYRAFARGDAPPKS